ncbi:MAG TPA: redoxin domain-containing protein [Desulfobacterales bacterium]
MSDQNASSGKGRIPLFELESTAGTVVGPAQYRQHKHLVLFFCAEADMSGCRSAVEALDKTAVEMEKMNAEILGVFGGDPRRTKALQKDLHPRFTILLDPDRNATRKCLSDDADLPMILVCDRFGDVWDRLRIADMSAKATIEKAVESLAFMELQCPECGVPDSPPPA